MANTLQDESPIPCSNETNFEFDNCFYGSLEKDLMLQFDCVVPFISPTSGKGNYQIHTINSQIVLIFKLGLQPSSGKSHSDFQSYYYIKYLSNNRVGLSKRVGWKIHPICSTSG